MKLWLSDFTKIYLLWFYYTFLKFVLTDYCSDENVCITFTTNLRHNICLTLSNQLPQPVATVEPACVLLTLLTMSNVVLGLNSVNGGLASRALPPGITYPMTCNTALTQMRLRRSLRHFSSNVHLTQIDSISFFYIYIYIDFFSCCQRPWTFLYSRAI